MLTTFPCEFVLLICEDDLVSEENFFEAEELFDIIFPSPEEAVVELDICASCPESFLLIIDDSEDPDGVGIPASGKYTCQM